MCGAIGVSSNIPPTTNLQVAMRTWYTRQMSRLRPSNIFKVWRVENRLKHNQMPILHDVEKIFGLRFKTLLSELHSDSGLPL